MSQHSAGPYCADTGDHVISYRAEHDIGERASQREREWRNESMVEHKTSLLRNGERNE